MNSQLNIVTKVKLGFICWIRTYLQYVCFQALNGLAHRWLKNGKASTVPIYFNYCFLPEIYGYNDFVNFLKANGCIQVLSATKA